MTDSPAPSASATASTTPVPRTGTWQWQQKLRWFAAEIVIVVAGVLIALAINAWWQGRQDHALETRTLRELRDALANDLNDIRFNAGLHERAGASARRLREHLRARQPYAKALDADFGNILVSTYSVRDEIAYETLKQRGLGSITHDALRRAIGHLYGVRYPSIMPFQDQAWDFVNTHQIPFYSTHFKDIRFAESATPLDYDALLDSTEFAALLDWRIGMDVFQAELLRKLDTEVASLIALIDEELAQR